jgi:predicted SAM-dependent methyltransferase
MIPRIKKFIREKVPFALPVVASIRYRASKRRIRRLLEQRREIFVELGAGDKGGRGDWITIDRTKKCDIYWDLRRGIPFPDASIHKLYSSHFFEHLSFGEIQVFLDDCMRVLAPGGQFSICVPNARLFIEAYTKGDSVDAAALCGYTPAYNHTTRIDCVNYVAYMGGEHKYMFDEENLLFILRSKGLRNVRLRPFDSGLDLRERELESIYAEAEK